MLGKGIKGIFSRKKGDEVLRGEIPKKVLMDILVGLNLNASNLQVFYRDYPTLREQVDALNFMIKNDISTGIIIEKAFGITPEEFSKLMDDKEKAGDFKVHDPPADQAGAGQQVPDDGRGYQ